MKKYFLFILLFIETISFAQTTAPYKNPLLPVDERVKDLLSRMTPEEKFWQLFMCPGNVSVINDSITQHGVFGLQVSASSQGGGGQMLNYNTTQNAKTLANDINSIQKYYVEKTRLGIPAIMFDEALHGLVRSGCTSFPQSIALAATFDTSLMHDVASAILMKPKHAA